MSESQGASERTLRWTTARTVALLSLLLLLVLGACAAGAAGARETPAAPGSTPASTRLAARNATPQPTHAPTRAASASTTAPPAVPLSGLPRIAYDRLPPQARETIALIQAGGPFPYRQDGAVFQNRERRLPGKPGGYYHEYTVVTPGSADRGARRIVAGERGELYYTDDHYGNFRQVIMP
jgi:ribonuclease T1